VGTENMGRAVGTRRGEANLGTVLEMASVPKARKHDRRPDETTSEWIARITPNVDVTTTGT